MSKSDPDKVDTRNAPRPPPLPREKMSDRGLLLSLHERLDILAPQILSVGERLESIADTLAEHDRAWFTCMNFLEAEARASGANGRASMIHSEIEARRNRLTPAPRHDEPTNPGGG